MLDDGSSSYLHDVGGNSVAINDSTNAATYPMADALGSVRLTLDGSGKYQDAVTWDASGNMRTDDTSDGYGFGYAGEQYDASSDLYMLGARYYSPGTGSFLTRDTLDQNGSGAIAYNPYLYANGNPVTFTDPTGHAVGLTQSDVAQTGGVWLQEMAKLFGIAFVFICKISGDCAYQRDNQATSTGAETVHGTMSTGDLVRIVTHRTADWIAKHYPFLLAGDDLGNGIIGGEGGPITSGGGAGSGPEQPVDDPDIAVDSDLTSEAGEITYSETIPSPWDGGIRTTGFPNDDIRFTQTTYSENFSAEDNIKGASVDSVLEQLINGDMSTDSLEFTYIEYGGSTLIVNTNSYMALYQSNIPDDEWQTRDVTDVPIYESEIGKRLQRNGLPANGTDKMTTTYSPDFVGPLAEWDIPDF